MWYYCRRHGITENPVRSDKGSHRKLGPEDVLAAIEKNLPSFHTTASCYVSAEPTPSSQRDEIQHRLDTYADTNEAPSTECSELIRTGRDGRQRYSEAYKRKVLDAFETSGMSGKAFAEQCGVKYPTFASWLAKRRQHGGAPAAGPADPSTPAFLLAEIGDGSDALELTLPAASPPGPPRRGRPACLPP